MATSFPPAATAIVPRGIDSSRTGATKGPLVVKWIEAYCHYGEGDYWGQPYRLRPWQKAFVWSLYELAPNGVDRRYRNSLLGLPRGNGKSALIAAIGVYELCGGSRESPLVTVAAASFEQADLVFGDMKNICRSSPMLAPTVYIHDTEIILKDQPGKAYRVAAAAPTNEGQRPTCLLVDELHAWEGNKERVHLILANGCAKRKNAFVLNISTAGHDDESLLGRMYAHGLKVNSGEIDDPGFLMTWYQGNPDVAPATRDEWREEIQASNPAAGDFLDTEAVVSRCMEIPAFEADRYHRNLWRETDRQWEVAALWDGLQSDLELDPRLPIFVGVDVGVKFDSSAVVVAQQRGDRIVLRAKVWENPEAAGTARHDNWKFQIADAEQYLRDLHQKFKSRARQLAGPAFYYDPWSFERSAQDLESEGLNMIEYPQQDARMIPASQALFDLCKSGVIAHNGDPVLRRHIRNVVAEAKPRGWRISKAKAIKKIDAAVATAIAVVECTRTEPPGPTPGIRIITAGDEEQ